MKKVVVLGASGMAGHVLFSELQSIKDFEVWGTKNKTNIDSRNLIQLDVFDLDSLNQLITNLKPDIVINCIGTLIRESKEHPEKAIYTNAFIPHQLVGLLNHTNGKLIHISTDCVFSGKKGDYTEYSPKDAKDIYGQSKALGEIDLPGHLTIRTSIIGPEIKLTGEGLFDWFMHQHGVINGYDNAFWGGVTTLELAKSIPYFVKQEISGIYNLTNSTKISKFDLLAMFKDAFLKQDLTINHFDNEKIDKSLIDTRKELHYTVAGYKTMINEMKNYMLENPSLYQKYFR